LLSHESAFSGAEVDERLAQVDELKDSLANLQTTVDNLDNVSNLSEMKEKLLTIYNNFNAFTALIEEIIDSKDKHYELLREILTQDRVQSILKLQGVETIPGNSSQIIDIYCGFDACEIKTVEARGSNNPSNFQLEILEDDIEHKILFQSLVSSHIYTNTGDLCNINKDKKIYLRISNRLAETVDVTYEIKLVNLIAAEINSEGGAEINE